MKRKLVLNSRFDSDLAYVVIINGIVVAFCYSRVDAVILAEGYRKRPSKPIVEVGEAVVRFGMGVLNSEL